MLYSLFLLVFLLLALLVLFIVISEFFGFLITRVPFVPTAAGDIIFIVEKLNITSKDVFFDLGSGNGKVCFLVNKLTGAKCVGFELTWWTHLLAQIRLKIHPVKSAGGGTATQSFNRVKFRNQNFFKHSWQEADFIYAYLYPPLMGRVKEKFLLDCKPGSVAIVRDFPLPGLKPTQVFYMPKNHEIYVYHVRENTSDEANNKTILHG